MHARSIETAKQKLDLDHVHREAESKKQERRKKLTELRSHFKAILGQNQSLPEHMRLQPLVTHPLFHPGIDIFTKKITKKKFCIQMCYNTLSNRMKRCELPSQMKCLNCSHVADVDLTCVLGAGNQLPFPGGKWEIDGWESERSEERIGLGDREMQYRPAEAPWLVLSFLFSLTPLSKFLSRTKNFIFSLKCWGFFLTRSHSLSVSFNRILGSSVCDTVTVSAISSDHNVSTYSLIDLAKKLHQLKQQERVVQDSDPDTLDECSSKEEEETEVISDQSTGVCETTSSKILLSVTL